MLCMAAILNLIKNKHAKETPINKKDLLIIWSVTLSEYNNNSSSDLVVIVDMKINFGNYNKLYLIEWHINSNKEIYGYNVWGY